MARREAELVTVQGEAGFGARQHRTGPSVAQGDAGLGVGQGIAECGTVQGDADHGVHAHTTVRAPRGDTATTQVSGL